MAVEWGREKRREKRGGKKKAVLDWLEGGDFLKQLIGFVRGLVCAYANGITLTK